MNDKSVLKEISCPKDNKLRAIKAVIRKEQLSFMERTASEALEKEHRKLAQTETDEFQKEVHHQLAEAQAKMRKEGIVKLALVCPVHAGEGEYSFFFENLSQYAPIIKENVLRCLKCGDPVTLENTKTSAGFKVLNIRCPHHGTGQRKISSSIYDIIMQANSLPPALAPPQIETTTQLPPVTPIPQGKGDVVISFCWNCGAKVIDTASQYCWKCGGPLKPP